MSSKSSTLECYPVHSMFVNSWSVRAHETTPTLADGALGGLSGVYFGDQTLQHDVTPCDRTGSRCL